MNKLIRLKLTLRHFWNYNGKSKDLELRQILRAWKMAKLMYNFRVLDGRYKGPIWAAKKLTAEQERIKMYRNIGILFPHTTNAQKDKIYDSFMTK